MRENPYLCSGFNLFKKGGWYEKDDFTIPVGMRRDGAGR